MFFNVFFVLDICVSLCINLVQPERAGLVHMGTIEHGKMHSIVTETFKL